MKWWLIALAVAGGIYFGPFVGASKARRKAQRASGDLFQCDETTE